MQMLMLSDESREREREKISPSEKKSKRYGNVVSWWGNRARQVTDDSDK